MSSDPQQAEGDQVTFHVFIVSPLTRSKATCPQLIQVRKVSTIDDCCEPCRALEVDLSASVQLEDLRQKFCLVLVIQPIEPHGEGLADLTCSLRIGSHFPDKLLAHLYWYQKEGRDLDRFELWSKPQHDLGRSCFMGLGRWAWRVAGVGRWRAARAWSGP